MKDWQIKKLGEVVDVFDNLRKPINSTERLKRISGKNTKDLFPYYGATGQVGWIDSYLIEGEFILVGEDGAPFLDNYKSKAYKIFGKTWVNNHAHILKEKENLTLNNFILYYLNSIDYRQYVNGTTRLKLTKGSLLDIPFPLPPLETQHAIVSKIEELFSELDKGIAELKTAQQQLKTYRQSVLKSAFEGKLTNENVKDGELPDGWEWKTFNDVCLRIGDIDHKMPKKTEYGKFPYLSTKDITNDFKLSFDNVKLISEEDYLMLSRKIKPEKGDIIFPRYGTIGKNVLVDTDKEFLISYSCAIIKPNTNLINEKYIYLFSLSPKVTDEIRKYVVETTQANIGIGSIKSFVFPLAPLKEQHRIVQEIESRLSVADKMEQSIQESLQKAEALRQSILKKAFCGELV